MPPIVIQIKPILKQTDKMAPNLTQKQETRMERCLIRNPDYGIPSLPLQTTESAVLIERKAFSHLSYPKLLVTPGNRSSGDHVSQLINPEWLR